jgi:hypothetical protein
VCHSPGGQAAIYDEVLQVDSEEQWNEEIESLICAAFSNITGDSGVRRQ